MDFLNALAERYETLHYMPPCGRFSDLWDVPGSEWAGVLRLICAESNFENLLVMLNPSMPEFGELLPVCDVVLVAGKGDPVSRCLTERFFHLAERSGGEGARGRFHPVILTDVWGEVPDGPEDLRRSLLFGRQAKEAEAELKKAGCL